MAHNKSQKKENISGEKTRRYEKIFVIASLVFFVVYPFITRLTIHKVSRAEQYWFDTQNGYVQDLSLYCKEIAIIAFAAVAILFFIGERVFVDKPEPLNRNALRQLKIPLVLIGVMTLFATLSFAFSEYKDVALLGVFSEYEGYLAVISYVIVFVFGLYYMRKEDCVELFEHFVVVVSIFTGILCIIELLVKPILEFEFVHYLIAPAKYRELANSIKSEYFVGQSALSFNNPGFLGGFAALLLPIDLALVVKAKKLPYRIVRIISVALMSVALYGSDSRAAQISTLVCLPVVIIAAFRGSKEKKKNAVCFFITGVAAIASVVVIGALTQAHNSDKTVYESGPAAESSDLFKLDRATLEDGVLTFVSGQNKLICSVDREKLAVYMAGNHKEESFTDCIIISDGNKVIEGRKPSVYVNERLGTKLPGFAPDMPGYEMITVATQERMVYFCFGYDGPAQFAMTDKGFMSFVQGETLTDTINQPRVTGFESIYGFATGRGYIWVQSLPVMAECLLIGKGCGNFPFYFTQNEIVGLLNTHGSMKYIIDRPHNWYIQSFVSNGLLYTLSMLLLFLVCIIGFVRRAIRKEIAVFDAGLFAGCLAFMIAGLINDSCITVNPIFWLVFGMSVRRFTVIKAK